MPPPLSRPNAEPLRLAFERNFSKQVQSVIEADLEAAKVPSWEPCFELPLRALVHTGCSEDSIRPPIETGADIDVTNAEGHSPHDLVSSGEAKEIISAPPIEVFGTFGTAERTERVRESIMQAVGVAPPPPWELLGAPRR